MAGTRQLHVTERPQVPLLSVILGYGPMLPFAIGALIAWTFTGPWRDELLFLTIVWGACILTFLSGVRRGLSFRTEGGPSFMQLATMLGIFTIGLAAVIALHHHRWVLAAILEMAGFAFVALVDPLAANRAEAPLFFARLRPFQMSIAVLGLAALTAGILVKG